MLTIRMSLRRYLLLIILISSNLSVVNASAIEVDKQAVFESLDDYFDLLVKHNKFVGSVGLYNNGELEYQYVSTFEHGKVVSSDKALKYRVGSITKMLTGVMVMQLIEEGKITLETNLAEFFPEVPNAEIITVGQMLNHRSGLSTYTDGPVFRQKSRSPQTVETIMGWIKARQSEFAPGAKAVYSNSNFYLLGKIIEKVTDHSFQDNLSARITDRLALKNTYFGGNIDPKKDEVNSYSWRRNKWRPARETDTSVLFSAGAIVSTTEDLNRFIHALFEGRLLTKGSLASMLEIEDGFGKAIFRKEIEGIESFGHNGNLDGFRTKLSYLPSTKLGIVILSNGLQTNRKDIVAALVAANSGKLVELPVILSEQQLMAYSGLYQAPGFPLDITVFTKNGSLMAKATGQSEFPLTYVSTNRFRYIPANIVFQFEPNKQQMLLSQEGRETLFTKPVPVTLSEEQLKRFIGEYHSEDLPLNITIFVKNGALMAQATGQKAFPLTATSENQFSFMPANIVFQFNPEKKQVLFSQKGRKALLRQTQS